MSKVGLLSATLAILAAAVPAAAQTATPGPGIPLEVATRRAAIVSDLRYELSLNVPREQQAPITGTMTASFALSRRVAAAGPRLRARRRQREERAR